MENPTQQTSSFRKNLPPSSTNSRIGSMCLGVSLLLSTLGCSSTPTTITEKTLIARKKDSTYGNPYPWGGHEETVKNAISNLDKLKSEIEVKLKGKEREELLQRIDVVKKLIDETEEALRQGKSEELTPTLSWLHQVNLWTLQEMEYLARL